MIELQFTATGELTPESSTAVDQFLSQNRLPWLEDVIETPVDIDPRFGPAFQKITEDLISAAVAGNLKLDLELFVEPGVEGASARLGENPNAISGLEQPLTEFNQALKPVSGLPNMRIHFVQTESAAANTNLYRIDFHPAGVEGYEKDAIRSINLELRM